MALTKTQIKIREAKRHLLRKRRFEHKTCFFYSLCRDVAAYNDDFFVNCKKCNAFEIEQRPWPRWHIKVAVNILKGLKKHFKDRYFAAIINNGLAGKDFGTEPETVRYITPPPAPPRPQWPSRQMLLFTA